MMDDAAYVGPERRLPQDYLRIGGLEIPYVSRDRAIASIDRSLDGAGQICVAFCNANTMLKALDSTDYARMLSRFLVLNDGVGVDLCSRLFNGCRFEENLNGTDFTPALLESSRHSFKIFLLGAAPGVAVAAGARISERYPRHSVVGARHGYFGDDEADAVIAEINRSGADLLLVALGNPRQEQFVAAHASKIDAPVVMMVGALFDFIAGRVVRAPYIVRALRAEWLFRLAQEPRRLGRRYTIDVVRFFGRIAWLKAKQARAEYVPVRSRRLRPEN